MTYFVYMSFFPSFCLEKLFPGWILCFFSFSLSLFRPFPSLVYPICLYHRALSYIVRSLAPFIIKIILIKIIILKNNSCNNNQSRRVRIHGCVCVRVCCESAREREREEEGRWAWNSGKRYTLSSAWHFICISYSFFICSRHHYTATSCADTILYLEWNKR